MHDAVTARTSVGESPLILGYAGLAPQVCAAAFGCFDSANTIGAMFAFGYATLILSFLGGIWWGFAMHTEALQGRIAIWAVMPSLFGALLILLSIGHVIPMSLALILLGSAVIATLLIDKRLVEAGIAPSGWMAMRIPLSIGLGGLTILSGALCGLTAA